MSPRQTNPNDNGLQRITIVFFLMFHCYGRFFRSKEPRHSEKLFIHQAISYNEPILKTENGGFRAFGGMFDPGRGRIGPALLKVRLAFLRDASNDVCRFFRRRGMLFFFRYTAVFSKLVSDAIYPKNRPCFRIEVRYTSVTGFAFLFFQTDILNKQQPSLRLFGR